VSTVSTGIGNVFAAVLKHHFSKVGLMFYAQIHKLDKLLKSGNLGGPIAGL
jgi:hypothetical protein